MIKPRDPRELAVDLLPRSTCQVQVAAVIADKHGIFSWGTNHVGFDGLGQCAEREAIRRANKKRLRGATIFVTGQRRRNGKIVTAKPCEKCRPVINKWELNVVYLNSDGWWIYG